MSLIRKLEILNISSNNLDTITEIGSLSNLRELFTSNNNLNDMKEMSVLLKFWPRLFKLELNGNPICSKNKYRERIIVQAPYLLTLDGKEIQDLERQFLQNWKVSKEITQQKAKQDNQYSSENSIF
jgi:protein phosphatase 1 regulatory subunit 42